MSNAEVHYRLAQLADVPFYRHRGAVDLNRHWMMWNDIGRVLQLHATPAL
jgi:hypothetical protein